MQRPETSSGKQRPRGTLLQPVAVVWILLCRIGGSCYVLAARLEIDTVEIPKDEAPGNEIPGKCMYQGKPVSICSRNEPTKHYQELCSACKTVRLHKKNKSGLCPDCVADRRRLNKNQI